MLLDFRSQSTSRYDASDHPLYFTYPANVEPITHTTQWIQFDATVAEVEDLLFTDYFYWEHTSTGSENIAAGEYHIPAHVQTHIDCKWLPAA